MIEVNLLKKKKKFKAPVILGIDFGKIGFVTYLVSLLAVLVWKIPPGYIIEKFNKKEAVVIKEIKGLNDKLNKIKSDLAKNKGIESKLKFYKKQIGLLESRANQVDKIMRKKTNPKFLLEKMAKLIPEDMWFDSLEITEKKEFIIKGGSKSFDSMSSFIGLANASPFFKDGFQENLKLTSTKTVTEKYYGRKNSIESFEIKGKIILFDPWAEE